MNVQYRKRIRLLPWLTLNLGTGWPSLSVKLGRVTVSSRGRVTVRGPRGWSWRENLR